MCLVFIFLFFYFFLSIFTEAAMVLLFENLDRSKPVKASLSGNPNKLYADEAICFLFKFHNSLFDILSCNIVHVCVTFSISANRFSSVFHNLS